MPSLPLHPLQREPVPLSSTASAWGPSPRAGVPGCSEDSRHFQAGHSGSGRLGVAVASRREKALEINDAGKGRLPPRGVLGRGLGRRCRKEPLRGSKLEADALVTLSPCGMLTQNRQWPTTLATGGSHFTGRDMEAQEGE